jgi:NADH:ubiquinone oxidoreductase subunit 5 (subunit L)/multisubunit Na+/H+ antiporter MnhA subunit
LFLVFITKTNVPFNVFYRIREMRPLVAFPLTILTFLSIFSGYVLCDAFLGLSSEFFSDVLPNTKVKNSLESEHLSFFTKMLPTYLGILGYFLGINYDVVFLRRSVYTVVLSKDLNCALYADSIFNRGVVLPLCKVALIFCFRLIDKYILELCGPSGFFQNLKVLFFSTTPVVGGRADRLVALTLYLIVVFLIFV